MENLLLESSKTHTFVTTCIELDGCIIIPEAPLSFIRVIVKSRAQYLRFTLDSLLLTTPIIMPKKDFDDYSPHNLLEKPLLSHVSNVLLIDNYDSFTWNIYQYLKLEGAAEVTVVRNDAVTLENLINTKPSHLVISPGPGHPEVDAGISNAAIHHFGGKIPVLGICLGQ